VVGVRALRVGFVLFVIISLGNKPFAGLSGEASCFSCGLGDLWWGFVLFVLGWVVFGGVRALRD